MRRLLIICLLLFASLSWAATLQWNASAVDETHSSPTGYRIHRGTAPGVYDWQVDVGLALTWPIPDDLYGEYYWTASAYNESGQSGYSNEVYWQRAPPEPPQYMGAVVLSASKLRKDDKVMTDIGTPGAQDFGCAPYSGSLPSGFSALSGSSTPGDDQWGNYEYSDGSIMVWIPKFYYKVTAPNSIDIKGTDTYATTAAANAAGYALHRAFIDGGSEKAGFFVDKYMVSKTAHGTGYIASSIKDGLPISTNSAHNPIADLTASGGTNAYYRVIDCAHARDGVNGAVNASSIFNVASRFQHGALAMLSLAHGQASSGTTYNAWYSASTTNFPKGCNDNSRSDTNDTSVIWESDGYSNACKTGSAGYGGGAGNLFAKSTHNGQNSGVADLNGGMWEISIGVTAISTTASITAATQANPCQITASSHGLSTGDYVQITDVGGMTQINNKIFKVTVIDTSNYTLDGTDSSAFGAYTSGGTSRRGTFYVAKQATAMKSFTSGNSGATDHWGATGVAAMMDSFVPAFETAYSSNGYAQRMGSSTNQVISGDTSGSAWLLAGLGFPKDADGIDTSGTSVFGQDYFYQYITNELCLISGGTWDYYSGAGVWASRWADVRSDSGARVGFRVACYPDTGGGTSAVPAMIRSYRARRE